MPPKSEKFDLYTVGFDYELRTCRNPWRMVQCRQCSHVWLNPRPALATLPVIYPPTYYSYNYKQQINPIATWAKAVLDRRKMRGILRKLAAAPKTGNPGIQMTNLIGDPTKPGLYTVRVALAAHTQAKPHVHRDNRSVTVVSGTWSMGYGATMDEKALKALPAGSFYTEPANVAHFIEVKEPVVIEVRGTGPSTRMFVNSADNPK